MQKRKNVAIGSFTSRIFIPFEVIKDPAIVFDYLTILTITFIQKKYLKWKKIFEIESIQTTNLMICHFETNTIFFQKFYYISDGIEAVFWCIHKHNFVYPFV